MLSLDECRKCALEVLAVTLTREFYNHGRILCKFFGRINADYRDVYEIELLQNLLKEAQTLCKNIY